MTFPFWNVSGYQYQRNNYHDTFCSLVHFVCAVHYTHAFHVDPCTVHRIELSLALNADLAIASAGFFVLWLVCRLEKKIFLYGLPKDV